MHPGWHILIAIVTIGEPRNIFSKVLHGILCIIIYYALQKALQALGADQKLILLISMCNGKFHHLLFKVFCKLFQLFLTLKHFVPRHETLRATSWLTLFQRMEQNQITRK